MRLFAVTLIHTTKNGEAIWFPFEHPDCETLEELRAALMRDGSVIGFRHRFDYKTGRLKSRDQLVVNNAGISSIGYFSREDGGGPAKKSD